MPHFLQKKLHLLSFSRPLIRHTSRAGNTRLQESDMTSQGTSAQTLKSIAGSFLVAPGLVLLCGDMDGVVTRWHQLLGSTPDSGLGVRSSVILAASFSPRQLFQGLLDALPTAASRLNRSTIAMECLFGQGWAF